MKYTQALEVIQEHRHVHFKALYDGDVLCLWGNEEGYYVHTEDGLYNVGQPWYLFELDWS